MCLRCVASFEYLKMRYTRVGGCNTKIERKKGSIGYGKLLFSLQQQGLPKTSGKCGSFDESNWISKVLSGHHHDHVSHVQLSRLHVLDRKSVV